MAAGWKAGTQIHDIKDLLSLVGKKFGLLAVCAKQLVLIHDSDNFRTPDLGQPWDDAEDGIKAEVLILTFDVIQNNDSVLENSAGEKT
jgi:hypothetical protein